MEVCPLLECRSGLRTHVHLRASEDRTATTLCCLVCLSSPHSSVLMYGVYGADLQVDGGVQLLPRFSR